MIETANKDIKEYFSSSVLLTKYIMQCLYNEIKAQPSSH